MDLEIKRNRRKRAVCRRLSIKWGNLTKDKAQEFEERLLAMRAWRSRGTRLGCGPRQRVALGKLLERFWRSRRVILWVIKGTDGGIERSKVRWTLRK